MVLRRRTRSICDKENMSSDSSPVEHFKNKAYRPSSISQRRRNKAGKNSLGKRGVPREHVTESFIREGRAVDGFLFAQRALKTKIGSAFQQLKENDVCSKEHFGKEADRQNASVKARRCSSSARHPSSSRRPSRHVVEKRKQFQDALTELKTKVWKTGKEPNMDCALQHNLADFNSTEMRRMQPEMNSASDRLLFERSFPLTPFNVSPMAAWLARPSKQQRYSGDGNSMHNRRSPFCFDHSSTDGSGFCELGAFQLPSLPHIGEEFLGQPSSLDTKISQWGRTRARRQPKRKIAPLRRSKSSNSLQTQRGSGFFWDMPDVLEELSAESSLLDQIQQLRAALEKSDETLKEYIAESTKNRAQILEQIDQLTALYSSLSQTQDIRYRSLLDVFHENYKLLGYVESNFDYVLSVVARGRRSNLQGRFYDLLRFIADYTMAPLFFVVRFGSRFYLRLFPRRADLNN